MDDNDDWPQRVFGDLHLCCSQKFSVNHMNFVRKNAMNFSVINGYSKNYS